MRAALGLSAALVLSLTPLHASALSRPWKVLVLLYAQTSQASCVVVSPSGVKTTYIGNASFTAPQVAVVKAAVDDFERIVSEWSGGLAAVDVTLVEPARAIASATFDGTDGCWLAPEDAAAELDQYLPEGDYDSVIALWHEGITPGPLGAASLQPLTWQGRRITWSTVHARAAFLPTPEEAGPNFRNPGEAILHEWLHPVAAFYRSLGYSVPDADDSDGFPYPTDNPGGIGGFSEFYTRLMHGRLVDALGKYSGASPAVWAAGSLRAGSGVQPAPQQIVAPVDLLCQPADAVLEWTGPWPAQTIFEVRLDDDQGGFIIHQTNQRHVALSALPIQTGRTYAWKVRTLAAPAGSEIDELGFRATGPGPKPPIFIPDGVQLEEANATVFVHADRGTEVRYTINGADPTPSDPLVPATGEVPVVPPALLKARAFAPGCAASTLKSAFYGLATVLTVTSTNDSPIGPPESGTLRWAITEANLAPGRQVIQFAIPGTGVHTIDFAAPLPVITEGVLIDGWSQPGWNGPPLIELDGAIGGSGLTLQGGNSYVRGLILNNWGAHGIRIDLLGYNRVRGCYIGTDAAGTAARANLGHGIWITGSANNEIGGVGAFQGNLISGNRLRGIQIEGPFATDNSILGNRIGTDLAGAVRISNGYGGVQLDNAASTQVGGTALAARNVISGNGFAGVADAGDGIGIVGPLATDNVVQGNYIGTNASGTADLGNSGAGVVITELTTRPGPSASRNRIGGTEPGARNVISGNDESGIEIVAVGGGATDNVVQGNYIGTDASGSFDLGNTFSGVLITRGTATGETGSHNLIGGAEPGARNVISGNNLDGVGIVGRGGDGNVVQGNYIGTDAQGSFDVGNSRSGVRLTTNAAFPAAATLNTVGGAGSAERNVVSGNDQNGIAIVAGPGDGGGNVIRGNLVGLGVNLTALGNTLDGILVTSLPLGGQTVANFIGTGAGNTIGRNGRNGIRLEGTGGGESFVDDNLIGIDKKGNPQPNGSDGIFSSSPQNSFDGNTIASNSGAGIVVSGAARNGLIRNSISDNGQLGIDLINGNNLQPAPVVSSVITSSGTLLQGTLAALPNTEYSVEFFSSPSCDASGAGEGKSRLELFPLTTNASGNASFSWVTESVPLGQVVTATATEFAEDNTSEFSACRTAAAGPPGDPDGDLNPGGGDNCPNVPNPGQEDTGGLNTALPDGRGNACECGDVTGEGIVNAGDVDLFRAHLVNPGVPWGGALLGRCSAFGSAPALCNLVDVVVLRRALAGKTPAIAGNCALL